VGETRKRVEPWGLARRILPPVLTLIIIAWLLSQISVRDVIGLLSNLTYRWVVVGLACYSMTNVCRAFRLKVLLPYQATHLRNLVSIAIAQSMFNNTLPARTGELSLVYLLNKHEDVPLDRAAVTLIVARVFDFVAVAMIYNAAALVSLRSLPQYASNIILIVSAVMLLMIALVLSAAWLGKRGLHVIQWIVQRLKVDQHPIARFCLEKISQVIEALEATHSLKRYLYVFVWSLLVWFGTFAWFYAFLRSIGIQVMVTSMVVGSTFAVLSKAVPFISVGGLGAHEAGWTAGFMLVGFDKTAAIASGFAVNILTMLSSLALGPWGLWILRRTRSGSSQRLSNAGNADKGSTLILK
jgi:uncharacterized protein (TIRG00374 family)